MSQPVREGRRFLMRARRGAAVAAAALGIAMAGCGGGPTAVRAVIGQQAPPLADVRWVPPFALGEEPSVFNEQPTLGNVVVLDFYASW